MLWLKLTNNPGGWLSICSRLHLIRKTRDKTILLAVLPEAERGRIFPHLELVSMELGDVLYESGGELRYVYFPVTAIVSLLSVMENGASAEIAIVGYEGIVGIALFMVFILLKDTHD